MLAIPSISKALSLLTLAIVTSFVLPTNAQQTAGTYEVKEIAAQRDGMSIYGQAYVPTHRPGRVPLVIMAHGFGGTYATNAKYAEYLAANGIAAYVFDFIGGSNASRSDGETADMSVLTEVEDMAAVLDQLRGLEFVDPQHLFLMGESQGGLVAALLAAKRSQEIEGLILLYPALLIPENARSAYPSPLAVPATVELWGVTLGAGYYTDVLDMDVYSEIAFFSGPVVIMHGTDDRLVDLSYSQRAVDAFASAELVVLQGAGHGFYGDDARAAGETIVSFANRLAAHR